MPKNIKVAIAGVGNCASALVQGVEYYRSRRNAALDGVMRQTIGGYRASDVEFVAAFDVDKRKVGRSLEEAIFAKPNNTRVFQSSLPVSNVVVQMGPAASTGWRRTWPTTTTTSPFVRPISSRPTSPTPCASRAPKCCCATCRSAPTRP